jgi:hypothetical protein
MITPKIQSLFDFITFLDSKKLEFIEKYIPLCDELEKLDIERFKLKPKENYNDKIAYDKIQNKIEVKFEPLKEFVHKPILNKLKELGIWKGDDVYTSIWNSNSSEVFNFRENFNQEDVEVVMNYKLKYINFRTQTNSNFLGLQFVFNSLDEIYKALFDFFKDTENNEFGNFETKTINATSIEEVVKGLIDNKGRNVNFSFPIPRIDHNSNMNNKQEKTTHIKNEIIIGDKVMGDKIKVGDISNNSGQIVIGKDIKIADSLNEKKESSEKIEELISLIRAEMNLSEEQRQTLITNFDKIKEEVLEDKPDKLKVYKWFSNTKKIIENIVLSHELTQAIQWIYDNFNFVFHTFNG